VFAASAATRVTAVGLTGPADLLAIDQAGKHGGPVVLDVGRLVVPADRLGFAGWADALCPPGLAAAFCACVTLAEQAVVTESPQASTAAWIAAAVSLLRLATRDIASS
jgi:hypothetical protein